MLARLATALQVAWGGGGGSGGGIGWGIDGTSQSGVFEGPPAAMMDFLTQLIWSWLVNLAPNSMTRVESHVVPSAAVNLKADFVTVKGTMPGQAAIAAFLRASPLSVI